MYLTSAKLTQCIITTQTTFGSLLPIEKHANLCFGVTLGVEQYASMRVADNVDIYADLALDIAVFSQELQKNTRSGDRVSEEQSALTKYKFKECVRFSPSVGVSVRF